MICVISSTYIIFVMNGSLVETHVDERYIRLRRIVNPGVPRQWYEVGPLPKKVGKYRVMADMKNSSVSPKGRCGFSNKWNSTIDPGNVRKVYGKATVTTQHIKQRITKSGICRAKFWFYKKNSLRES